MRIGTVASPGTPVPFAAIVEEPALFALPA
jgi:hypothetical protein